MQARINPGLGLDAPPHIRGLLPPPATQTLAGARNRRKAVRRLLIVSGFRGHYHWLLDDRRLLDHDFARGVRVLPLHFLVR